MALFKGFFTAKPVTTNEVAQAIDPTVTAVHPKSDKTPGDAWKTNESNEATPSETTLDEKNPFSDPKIASNYRQVYEDSRYECRGAFDPDLEWTSAEERKLVRKLDYRVCAFACFAFFALQVDRGNMAQAVSDNLLNDLGLTTNDYNTGGVLMHETFQ